MSVRLHIDRLVLDGIAVSQADRPLLQKAIERELVRLIGEGGVRADFTAGLNVPSVEAGDLQIQPRGSAADLGHQIAGALYGGLRR